MPIHAAPCRLAPLLLLACTGQSPVTPGPSGGGGDDSEAPVDSEPAVDWRGRALVYADYWGVHLVDLELGANTRFNQDAGARVYLSPDSATVLSTTSGAALTSELRALDGTLIEDFSGAALGFAGPDFIVTADVDPESLYEGPLYSWFLGDMKQERIYNVDGHIIEWGPHSHFGEVNALLVLDESTEVPTAISFEPPTTARSRELSLPAPPILTVDGRAAWLDAQGELWVSDAELREVEQLSHGLGGASLAPWREPGRVLLAYDSGQGPQVRIYDLDRQDLVPLGALGDVEGFDPFETRVRAEQERVAFRVGQSFYLWDLESDTVEEVAEAFGEVTGWDW